MALDRLRAEDEGKSSVASQLDSSLGPETDCMIAETKGIFNSIADFSPDLNFTSGVFNETFAGIHSLVVKPGISKYSPNVLDTSFK